MKLNLASSVVRSLLYNRPVKVTTAAISRTPSRSFSSPRWKDDHYSTISKEDRKIQNEITCTTTSAYVGKGKVGGKVHEIPGRWRRKQRKKQVEEVKSRAIAAAASLPLTEQQSQVLNSIAQGHSVFITGSAGTGKTFLLKHAIQLLNHIHSPKHVFVTASTGVAACALNGQTLHSFAAVGLATADRDTLFLNAASNIRTSRRWKRAKALVIDEVSMIDGHFLDNLEYIARKLRCKHNDKVWGGLQLIVTGDFFQLPPVTTSPSSSSAKEFAFEADCWNASFDLQIELTHIFRQSDSKLIQLLEGIRRGCNDRNHLQLLNTRLLKSEPDSSLTRLFPRKQDVKRVNEDRLTSLGQKIITYTALDSGQEPCKSELKLGVAPEELDLCLGARVMLLKNINQSHGLVNGATGTIVGFVKPRKMITDLCCSQLLPRVQFDSGQEMVIKPDTWDVTVGDTVFATRKQVPLILAWALSIHKCQGMTLDCLHTDLSRAFGYGMVYVALSRVRTLDGLHLSGFSPWKIKAHPKVLNFYQILSGCQT